ncbi:ATP-binding cassette domain-containing protein [Paracrocinitomix mangrovi]|uniref:ATP-binding cassette domain-containing protein n=1 Tax=Paracrocinitomix mangrovi TaxID=2862509 RepID=UPI001C8E2C91|nr:ATP-binding cassette domain-containing protein [Paracrocinitomix mangrovi]UKN00585.1 ATP-binding cassette domain-containing protein [Paracrocinitomix mangrovi]
MLNIDIYKRLGNDKNKIEIRFKASANIGEITALYGKSGIGKTTVLRIIAGLDKANEGTITFKGHNWFNKDQNLPLKQRPVGMVFQDYNLFENMTVLKNLEFAADDQIAEDVLALCKKLGIDKMFSRYPRELSKGQQQKVAIIRGVIMKTELMLLDEPFSALDDDSILEIIEVIQALKSNFSTTIILVTHRKDVILKMADSVIVFAENKTTQGDPKELLQRSF